MKDQLDHVYKVGFKNGQIAMKNKVLKTINRDWGIVTIQRPLDVAMRILRKVNALKLIKPDLK